MRELIFFTMDYTVSMKLRSVRLKMMTERNRATSMKMVLYNRPPQLSEPQPIQLYLKASKIGVRGLSSRIVRILPLVVLIG